MFYNTSNKSMVAGIDSWMPKMTKEIMEGFVCHELDEVLPEIDRTLRKAYDGLFDGALRYIGLTPCTPQEAFEFSTRPKSSQRTFDLARSSLYLAKIQMTYDGYPLPDTFIYLPYWEPGGLMRIGGPLYHLMPMLSEKVISVEEEHIFVRLNQFKCNYYKQDYCIVVNGNFHDSYVVWGKIYKPKPGKKESRYSKADAILAHYLFSRKGFTQLFKEVTGFVPKVGTIGEMNDRNYPPEDWVVVTTGYRRRKPTGATKVTRVPTDLALAIPRDQWTLQMEAAVTAFFYIVDHFSEKFNPENLDDTRIWAFTLGLLLFNNEYTPGRILELVREHFESTDSYMDENSSIRLKERGLEVNTFTDLLQLLATRFYDFQKDGTEMGNLYGRSLKTLQEILDPVTVGIFTNKYDLLREGSKGKPSFNVVRDKFVRRFKPGKIYRIATKRQLTEIVSYCGDHMYLKITSRLARQRTVADPKAAAQSRGLDETGYLTTPQIMVGSILFLSKSDAVPLSHINPYVHVDIPTGTVLENQKLKSMMDELAKKLAQKS